MPVGGAVLIVEFMNQWECSIEPTLGASMNMRCCRPQNVTLKTTFPSRMQAFLALQQRNEREEVLCELSGQMSQWIRTLYFQRFFPCQCQGVMFLRTSIERDCTQCECGLSCLVGLNSDLYRLCGSLHSVDTFWARGLSWIHKETTTITTLWFWNFFFPITFRTFCFVLQIIKVK